MRELYNLSDSIKLQNKQHKPVDIKSIKKILANLKTAVPTDSSVHGDVFNAFADRLTLEFNSIETDSNFIFTFNNMVNSCVDCHNEFCPGPIKKINKLKITE